VKKPSFVSLSQRPAWPPIVTISPDALVFHFSGEIADGVLREILHRDDLPRQARSRIC
jgi:hypothetical protein